MKTILEVTHLSASQQSVLPQALRCVQRMGSLTGRSAPALSGGLGGRGPGGRGATTRKGARCGGGAPEGISATAGGNRNRAQEGKIKTNKT